MNALRPYASETIVIAVLLEQEKQMENRGKWNEELWRREVVLESDEGLGVANR